MHLEIQFIRFREWRVIEEVDRSFHIWLWWCRDASHLNWSNRVKQSVVLLLTSCENEGSQLSACRYSEEAWLPNPQVLDHLSTTITDSYRMRLFDLLFFTVLTLVWTTFALNMSYISMQFAVIDNTAGITCMLVCRWSRHEVCSFTMWRHGREVCPDRIIVVHNRLKKSTPTGPQ